MNEITFPTQSNATLIKASLISLVIAFIVYLTIILPAEFNSDPTGVGEFMGLTKLSKETPNNTITQPTNIASLGYKDDEKSFVIPPNKGIEYKFKIQKHGSLTYHWVTDGTPLYFDFHGEPKGDTTGYFESYTIATSLDMKGSMIAPFDGQHGWYWKNNSDHEVTVTLKTQGEYEVIGLVN